MMIYDNIFQPIKNRLRPSLLFCSQYLQILQNVLKCLKMLCYKYVNGYDNNINYIIINVTITYKTSFTKVI